MCLICGDNAMHIANPNSVQLPNVYQRHTVFLKSLNLRKQIVGPAQNNEVFRNATTSVGPNSWYEYKTDAKISAAATTAPESNPAASGVEKWSRRNFIAAAESVSLGSGVQS